VDDPAVPSPARFEEITVELTRDEDPHAPAARPGEHVAFFAEGEPVREPERIEPEGEPADGEEPVDGETSRDSDKSDEPHASSPRPAKRGGRKASGA
jgi:hypothetical protein